MVFGVTEINAANTGPYLSRISAGVDLQLSCNKDRHCGSVRPTHGSELTMQQSMEVHLWYSVFYLPVVHSVFLLPLIGSVLAAHSQPPAKYAIPWHSQL